MRLTTVPVLPGAKLMTSAPNKSCSSRCAWDAETPISRPIALASFHGLAWLFGIRVLPPPNVPGWPDRALEWTYFVIFALLIPIAFCCILRHWWRCPLQSFTQGLCYKSHTARWSV